MEVLAETCQQLQRQLFSPGGVLVGQTIPIKDIRVSGFRPKVFRFLGPVGFRSTDFSGNAGRAWLREGAAGIP